MHCGTPATTSPNVNSVLFTYQAPKIRQQIFSQDSNSHDVLTSPKEVNIQSLDVADEEQLFFLPDEEEESGKKILPEKELSKQRAIEKHEKDLSTKVTEFIKIPLNSAVYSFGAIKENARIRNEQDSEPLLKALKLRILHKHLLKTEPRGRKMGSLCGNIREKTDRLRTIKS